MKRIASFVLLVLCFVLIGCGENAVHTEPSPDSPADIAEEEMPQTDDGIVGEDVVTVPVTELIVPSAEEMPQPDELAKMTSLRRLDLTAIPYTPFSEIETIASKLPECEIIWNQMLTDGVFRSDSTDLILPNATAEDIDLLNVFSDLRSVDASGSTAYAALFAFRADHPQTDVRYSYQSGDFSLAIPDEAAVLPAGIDAEEFTQIAQYFPNLKTVDLRQSEWTETQTDAFCAKYRDLSVSRIVWIDQMQFDSDTVVLNLHDLSGWTVNGLAEKLRFFANLEAIGLPSDWSEGDASEFKTAFPDVRVAGKIELFGKEIDGSAEELDLSGTKLDDPAKVEELIGQMPFLKKLNVCNCGLNDDQMIALAEAHSDIRFVWVIHIGPHKLRTDAVGFSTKNPSKHTNSKASDEYNKKVKSTKRLHEGDIALLKYCYDLEALDLGHNYLTNSDLNVIAGLTKLKILILADNSITDISALTTLKDLEYIELFMNKIPDLSPLTEMPSLIDVNVCNVGVSDLTPLFSLTGAKRLWYAMNPFSRDQAVAVKNALPDCLCNYTTRDETSDGWRDDPRYRWMRSFFD